MSKRIYRLEWSDSGRCYGQYTSLRAARRAAVATERAVVYGTKGSFIRIIAYERGIDVRRRP